MKKYFYFFIVVGLLMQSINCFAVQDEPSNDDKRYILELLQKRKSLFNKYSQLNELKTGIFKNRTKKDVVKSKDMLNNIIAIDNKIISELDRLFEHKQFEQLSLGVDMLDYELKLNKQREIINSLHNEILIIKTQNDDLELELCQGKFWKYLFAVLSILLIITLIYVLVRKKSEY